MRLHKVENEYFQCVPDHRKLLTSLHYYRRSYQIPDNIPET